VTPVRATVSSEIVLRDLSARSIERLRFAVSYPNPEYVRAIRLGVKRPDLPLRFECMTEWPDGTISVPRGAIDILRGELAKDDLAIEFEDERTVGESLGTLPMLPLWSYQSLGVTRLESKMQGLIVLPCGGGKTFLGVGSIVRIARTTIVLVHTEDLLDQWAEDVREKLGIEPGIVDDTRKDVHAPIVIASVFSLLPMLEADPSLGRRFGLVILDEAHHAPAATTQKILRHLPARYRLGLTATPDREDGHTKMVDWSFGARLLVKTVQELVDGGFLMMPRFVDVPTRFEFPMDPDDKKRFTKLHRAIIKDEERNQLIVDLAYWQVQKGETVLLLSNRKEHCRRLGKMLEKLGVDARVVISTTSKKTRKTDLNELRAGTAPIVIATSLADEALNVKRLSKLILAFPERAQGRTTQRVGRLTRLWEGKDPVVYDVVDGQVEALVRRAADRRRAYRSMGMIP
jgi:superfamily II DNA or RNA helicase